MGLRGLGGAGRCVLSLPSVMPVGRSPLAGKRSVPQAHQWQMGDRFAESLWLSAALPTRYLMAKCRRRPMVSDTLPFLTSFYHPFLPQSPSMPNGGCPLWLTLPLEGGEQVGSRLWPIRHESSCSCGTLHPTYNLLFCYRLYPLFPKLGVSSLLPGLPSNPEAQSEEGGLLTLGVGSRLEPKLELFPRNPDQ